MIRLVASDLDGTLLRTDGTISDRTRAAWRAAAAAGLEMLVVTARPPRYLDAVAEILAVDGVPVGVAFCANGAVRYDLTTRRVVEVLPLHQELAEVVVAAVTAAVPGVGFAVETGSLLVFETRFARHDLGDVRRAVADLDDLWRHGSPIVKLLACSDESTADTLLALIRTAAGDLVECTHSGGRGLVEVSAVGVSKVSAVAAHCADRGIDRSEVLAFGDMPNDLAMLEWAGHGYAVANAHPLVLGAGLAVTAANDDDGVARVLERLVRRGA
jgi:Cof subfamily protein (haloacid dehalogenase superfamily)